MFAARVVNGMVVGVASLTEGPLRGQWQEIPEAVYTEIRRTGLFGTLANGVYTPPPPEQRTRV